MIVGSQAFFQELENSSFKTRVEETEVELQLTSVTPNDQTSSEKYECFSLLFDGPTSPALDQASYTFNTNKF